MSINKQTNTKCMIYLVPRKFLIDFQENSAQKNNWIANSTCKI